MMAGGRGSSGQYMGLGGLGMANSKSGDYNLLSSGYFAEDISIAILFENCCILIYISLKYVPKDPINKQWLR